MCFREESKRKMSFIHIYIYIYRERERERDILYLYICRLYSRPRGGADARDSLRSRDLGFRV